MKRHRVPGPRAPLVCAMGMHLWDPQGPRLRDVDFSPCLCRRARARLVDDRIVITEA